MVKLSGKPMTPLYPWFLFKGFNWETDVVSNSIHAEANVNLKMIYYSANSHSSCIFLFWLFTTLSKSLCSSLFFFSIFITLTVFLSLCLSHFLSFSVVVILFLSLYHHCNWFFCWLGHRKMSFYYLHLIPWIEEACSSILYVSISHPVFSQSLFITLSLPLSRYVSLSMCLSASL